MKIEFSRNDSKSIKKNLIIDIQKIEIYEDVKFDGLSNWNIWSYAVGLFQNDISSTSLMSYFPLFIKEIYPIHNQNPSYWVGFVVLIGQIINAIATPLVGIFSDRLNFSFGKRKAWHYFGSICSLLGFVFCFLPCCFCELFSINSDANKIANYTIFFCLFNVGWASCQVTNLALVPSLTVSRSRRDFLNGLRNSFTYIANFIALLIVLLIFNFVDNSLEQFEFIVILIGLIGMLMSLNFWIGVPEKKLVNDCKRKTKEIRKLLDSNLVSNINFDDTPVIKHQEIISVDYNKKSQFMSVTSINEIMDTDFYIKFWFKKREFYHYGLVYVCIGLSYTIFQIFIPFYLIYTLKFTDHATATKLSVYLALFPLIIYIFSCFGSLFSPKLFVKFGRKKIYVISTIFITICSICIIFVTPETNFQMYLIFPLYGVGQSLNMNAGSGYIAEVIGQRGSQGAIVYGVYSFFDKLLGGTVFFATFQSDYMKDNNPEFYRFVLAGIPCLSTLVSCILVIIGKAADYNLNEDIKFGRDNLLDDFVK